MASIIPESSSALMEQDGQVRPTESTRNLITEGVHPVANTQKESLQLDPEAMLNGETEGSKGPISFFTTKRVVLGLMDVALLTANATQLRDVMELPYHPFKCGAFVLLVISIVFQFMATVIFMVVYWWDHRVNDTDHPLVIDPQRRLILDIFFGLLSLLGMVCVVVILAANIFIAAFLPTPSDRYMGHSNSTKCFFE